MNKVVASGVLAILALATGSAWAADPAPPPKISIRQTCENEVGNKVTGAQREAMIQECMGKMPAGANNQQGKPTAITSQKNGK